MRIASAEAFLVDVDGTLVKGGRMIAGADRLMRLIEGRAALVSNDAEHTPPQLARALSQLGLTIAPDRIILAGTAMLEAIARQSEGMRVLLLASPALGIYARDIGLRLVDRDPDVVALGRDRTFDYAKLAAAANAVRAGAGLVIANPDRVHPGSGGAVVPETGALMAAILACVDAVTPRIIGKPHPELFRRALTLLGAEAHRSVMIGDNPETDGRGAGAIGMPFLSAAAGLEPVLSRLFAPEDQGPSWVDRRMARS